MPLPSDRQLRDGLAGHQGRVEGYIKGTITPEEFRPMRLSYGLYYLGLAAFLGIMSYETHLLLPSRN